MEFSDFDEIIKFAIQREMDAIEGYGQMLEKAKNPGLKEILAELQNEERNHKKLLEDMTQMKIEAHQVKEVTDLQISDFLVEEPLTDEISFQDLLIFAAKKEQKAVELYSAMHDSVEEPELKKMFEFLIELGTSAGGYMGREGAKRGDWR